MRFLHALLLATAAALVVPPTSDALAKKPNKGKKNKGRGKAAQKPAKGKSAASSAVEIKGVRARATQSAVERIVGKLDRDDLRAEGKVTRKKGRLTLALVVLGGDGDELGSKSFTGKNDRILSRIVRRELPDFLAGLPAAEVEEQEPEETPVADDSSSSSDKEESESGALASASSSSSSGGSLALRANPGRAPGAATWSVAAGPELVGRSFTYRDDFFGELREYELAGAFAIAMKGDYYPLPAFGVAASLSLAPGFTTDGPFEEEFESSMSSLALGARYRRPLSRGWLLGALDYGQRSFSVGSTADEMSSGIPDVDYKFLRLAAHVSWPVLDRLSIDGSFGYRLVLATGQIESEEYFPRASAQGMDAELALGSRVMGVDVRAGMALERYGYALKPEPGDANVAGGAIDQYLHYFLTVGYSR